MYNDLIVKGMFAEIDRTKRSGASVATAAMVYIGIDAMTHLGLPLDRDQPVNRDFITWVNRYLRMNKNEHYEYSGIDLYAARCRLIQTYSREIEVGRDEPHRSFVYHFGPMHRYDPAEDNNVVMISVPRLVHDFYSAVYGFFSDAAHDKDLQASIDARMGAINERYFPKPPMGLSVPPPPKPDATAEPRGFVGRLFGN